MESLVYIVDVFFEEIRNGNPVIIGYCIFLGVWIWWMVRIIVGVWIKKERRRKLEMLKNV